MQEHFDLIPHQAEGSIIYQRPSDGYINATAMCRAAKREMKHYNENRGTKEFLVELATVVGIPTTLLVQAIQGGDPRHQGTWVHPQVAIHLAQWLSPAFAVKVTQWVYDWMSGRRPAAPAPLPYHLRRHMANLRNVPAGHFSILVEMTTLLIAPMEAMGYTLPERMLPDISNGKMFCGWLRKRGRYDGNAEVSARFRGWAHGLPERLSRCASRRLAPPLPRRVASGVVGRVLPREGCKGLGISAPPPAEAEGRLTFPCTFCKEVAPSGPPGGGLVVSGCRLHVLGHDAHPDALQSSSSWLTLPASSSPWSSDDLATSLFEGLADGALTTRCLAEIVRDILAEDMERITTPRLVGDWYLPLTAGERARVLSKLLVDEIARTEEDIRQMRLTMLGPKRTP